VVLGGRPVDASAVESLYMHHKTTLAVGCHLQSKVRI